MENFDKGSSSMVPPLYTAGASITPPQSPYSPLITTASLHTVPHHAITTNHRFWLVKRVQPMAFATARLSFPVAAVTVDAGRP